MPKDRPRVFFVQNPNYFDWSHSRNSHVQKEHINFGPAPSQIPKPRRQLGKGGALPIQALSLPISSKKGRDNLHLPTLQMLHGPSYPIGLPKGKRFGPLSLAYPKAPWEAHWIPRGLWGVPKGAKGTGAKEKGFPSR